MVVVVLVVVVGAIDLRCVVHGRRQRIITKGGKGVFKIPPRPPAPPRDADARDYVALAMWGGSTQKHSAISQWVAKSERPA